MQHSFRPSSTKEEGIFFLDHCHLFERRIMSSLCQGCEVDHPSQKQHLNGCLSSVIHLIPSDINKAVLCLQAEQARKWKHCQLILTIYERNTVMTFQISPEPIKDLRVGEVVPASFSKDKAMSFVLARKQYQWIGTRYGFRVDTAGNLFLIFTFSAIFEIPGVPSDHLVYSMTQSIPSTPLVFSSVPEPETPKKKKSRKRRWLIEEQETADEIRKSLFSHQSDQ